MDFTLFPLFCLAFIAVMFLACGFMFFRHRHGGTCCRGADCRTKPAQDAPVTH